MIAWPTRVILILHSKEVPLHRSFMLLTATKPVRGATTSDPVIKPAMGKAFHLEMTMTPWLDQLEEQMNLRDEVDAFLANLSPEDLTTK